jgi:hypothetical protein
VRRVGRRYGDAVREALIVVWEASDRVCSKRLKPLEPPSGHLAKNVCGTIRLAIALSEWYPLNGLVSA